jgi:hypothetical protein
MVAVLLATMAVASVAVRPLFAHEKGVLTIGTKQAAAGDTLRARGSKLAKDAGFRIELRGVLKTYPFGRVRSDTSGGFQMLVPLPADATAGSYTLVAIAADGDVSAQAEFMLTPSVAGGRATIGMPGMGKNAGMNGMDMSATAAMMDVPPNTSGSERAAIILVLATCAAAGLLLVWSSRGAT